MTYLLEIAYATVILCATVASLIGIGAAVRGLRRWWRGRRLSRRRVFMVGPYATVHVWDGTRMWVRDAMEGGSFPFRQHDATPETFKRRAECTASYRDYVLEQFDEWRERQPAIRESRTTQTTPNCGEDAPRSTSGAPYGSPVDESGRPITIREHLDSARMMGEALKKCVNDDMVALERKLELRLASFEAWVKSGFKVVDNEAPVEPIDTLPPGVRVWRSTPSAYEFVLDPARNRLYGAQRRLGAEWQLVGVNADNKPPLMFMGDMTREVTTELHSNAALMIYFDWRENHHE